MTVRHKLLPVVLAVGLLAGCGGDEPTGQTADSSQALVGKPTDPRTSSSETRLNEAHVNGASTTDASICDLVSASQATTILGGPIAEPATGPQGPTCIYRLERTPEGDDPRDGFITIAVQSRDLVSARRQLAGARQVDVGDRVGFCGERGQAMLLVEAARGETLTVTGPCSVARRFATLALQRLAG